VYVPAGVPLGTGVANITEVAGCSAPSLGKKAGDEGCTTVIQGPGGSAPPHNGIAYVPICAPGIAVGGSDPTSCEACFNITVIGACEVGGVSYRSTVSCPATPYVATVGSYVNVADLGCTGTNPVDGQVGELYFGALGNTSLKRIPYTSFFDNWSCEYVVGANPANQCKSYTRASQGKVTIGKGPLTTVGCPQPQA
jgi:hypothetical protein